MGDTRGIKQLTWELDRTPRHGGGKLDTFSGSSKLDYITNLMTHPRNFGHHSDMFAYGWGIRPTFFKIVSFPMGIPPLPHRRKTLILEIIIDIEIRS